MQVFLTYTSGSDNYLNYFETVLSRLAGIEPHVAERTMNEGIAIIDKIKSGIDRSVCLVAILTHNSECGVWQNQEIGYATAKGMHIIPFKEEGVQVKGFLEGKEWFTLQAYDMSLNAFQLIASLRQRLRVNYFKLNCTSCGLVSNIAIPDHKQILQAIEKNEHFIENCPSCNAQLMVNPATLETLPMQPFSQVAF